MARCWIGMGGNEGDVPAVFGEILRRLITQLSARDVLPSPLFRTAPVGAAAGSTFWNAVAGFDVAIEPLALLDQLQAWETEFGRVRTVRWGPRTLDLDLLYYGSLVLDSPRLTLPHPGAWHRRFVLEPLTCIAPELMHPQWQLTIAQLHERLAAQPPSVCLWARRVDDAATWRERLQSRLPQLEVAVSDGKLPASHGLMVALGEASPESWQTSPHLRFELHQPHDALEQSLIDACLAAYDVPVRID
jgi:2-amino-4-hydroxy-6-hydroxymethyldihydropteridine diphosphokinase